MVTGMATFMLILWVQVGDLYTRLYLKDDGASQPSELERMNAIYRKAADLGKGDPTIQAKVGDYFVLSRQVKDAIPHYLASLSSKNEMEKLPLQSNRRCIATSTAMHSSRGIRTPRRSFRQLKIVFGQPTLTMN